VYSRGKLKPDRKNAWEKIHNFFVENANSNTKNDDEESVNENDVQDDDDSSDDTVVAVVGTKWFVLNEGDMIEYPVEVVEDVSTEANTNLRRVQWIGYPDEEIVHINQLLPYTAKRQRFFETVAVPKLQRMEEEEQEEGDGAGGRDKDHFVRNPVVGGLYYHKVKGVVYPVKLLNFCASSKYEGKCQISYTNSQSKKYIFTSELLPARRGEEQIVRNPVVGGSYYHIVRGVEYPVKLLNFCARSKDEGKCQISYTNDQSKKYIFTSELLPARRGKEQIVRNPVVGGSYYHRVQGVEYPVTLLNFCTRSKHEGKCQISYTNYRSKKTIFTSELLPATENRATKYEAMRANTKLMHKKRQAELKTPKPREAARQTGRVKEQSTTKGRTRDTREASTKKTPERTKEKSNLAKRTIKEECANVDGRSEDDHTTYGPPTDVSNLPLINDVAAIQPGTFRIESKRILYFALNNETPAMIAKKANIPVGKVLYDNRKSYETLMIYDKLYSKTPIVLPIQWRGAQVDLTKGGVKAGNNIVASLDAARCPDPYEPATDVTNLPTTSDVRYRTIVPGTCVFQDNRVLYFACCNERIADIAHKFRIPLGKVLHDNRQKWGKKLHDRSQLRIRTPIVLPLSWQGSPVRMVQTPRDPSATRENSEESIFFERRTSPYNKISIL